MMLTCASNTILAPKAAAYSGHIECVEVLIRLGADVTLGKSDDDATPLFMYVTKTATANTRARHANTTG